MADMSIKYMGMTFWRSNADWYYIDEKCNRYVLTDKAPEEARRSFELYMKANWKVYRDLGFDGGSND